MIKDFLKKTFGSERLSEIKGVVYHYCCTIALFFSGTKKFEYNKNIIELQSIFTDSNYHVFRGYYDIDYANFDGTKFLCHRLPLNAKNNRQTQCEVGYYSLNTGDFEKIADTSAWCWQQGSRLRWIDQNRLVFNDVTDYNYCTRVFNVETKQQCGLIEWPLYDFTPDFRYGLSLNYSRLQRLRPGYGYDYFPDTTADKNAPEDDGIILVDITTGQSKVLYSLYQLAQNVENGGKYIHYINHISIGPDGKHFIFFHIYLKPGEKDWRVVLYVSDFLGNELKILEKEDQASHYCWIDNDHIMVTCRKDSGVEYYCTFDINTCEKKILKQHELCMDGHPHVANTQGMIVTDTYPLKNSLQSVKMFHMTDDDVKTIARFYHDYRMRGERRCDLHPSVSMNCKLLSVDTTYQKKRRSIVIFKMKMEK